MDSKTLRHIGGSMRINDKWILRHDGNCWVVQKIIINHDRVTKEIKEKYSNTYHPTLIQACEYLINNSIYEENTTKYLKDLKQEIIKTRTMLIDAINAKYI